MAPEQSTHVSRCKAVCVNLHKNMTLFCMWLRRPYCLVWCSHTTQRRIWPVDSWWLVGGQSRVPSGRQSSLFQVDRQSAFKVGHREQATCMFISSVYIQVSVCSKQYGNSNILSQKSVAHQEFFNNKYNFKRRVYLSLSEYIVYMYVYYQVLILYTLSQPSEHKQVLVQVI